MNKENLFSVTRHQFPEGVVDYIEMSYVAADVEAVAAFLAADTTDVLAADTTDVLSAAKAADGVFCPAFT